MNLDEFIPGEPICIKKHVAERLHVDRAATIDRAYPKLDVVALITTKGGAKGPRLLFRPVELEPYATLTDEAAMRGRLLASLHAKE